MPREWGTVFASAAGHGSHMPDATAVVLMRGGRRCPFGIYGTLLSSLYDGGMWFPSG